MPSRPTAVAGRASHPRTLTIEELQRFVAQLAATPARWRQLVGDLDGERVSEQISDDEYMNAWVIRWSENQETGFHDHDGSGAAIAVVSGRVREDRLTLGAGPRSREFEPGATWTVAPGAIHRVLHGGGEPAFTIHAYSPPLRQTGAYRVGPSGEVQRETQPLELELRTERAVA